MKAKRDFTCACCESSHSPEVSKPVRIGGRVVCESCAKNSLHMTSNEARLLLHALQHFISFVNDLLDPHSGLNKKERRTVKRQMTISKIVIQRLRRLIKK